MYDDFDNEVPSYYTHFSCPAMCAIESILTAPSSCLAKMKSGQCTHPICSSLSPEQLEAGALTVDQWATVLASIFQTTIGAYMTPEGSVIFAVTDESNQPKTALMEAQNSYATLEDVISGTALLSPFQQAVQAHELPPLPPVDPAVFGDELLDIMDLPEVEQ
jgi:hypothetical protein